MRLRTPGLLHGGTGTLDGELDQASVLAVRVDGMTGEEDRVPAVSWFQLRTFPGEKRSPFRLSYPEYRAPPFPYCSLLPPPAPAGAVPAEGGHPPKPQSPAQLCIKKFVL